VASSAQLPEICDIVAPEAYIQWLAKVSGLEGLMPCLAVLYDTDNTLSGCPRLPIVRLGIALQSGSGSFAATRPDSIAPFLCLMVSTAN